MKIRNGFVSNSSSASFVIKKEDLDYHQIILIKNHEIIAGMMGQASNDKYGQIGKFGFVGAWGIYEDMHEIRGTTTMDNFNMFEFLKAIGIPEDKIEYSSDN